MIDLINSWEEVKFVPVVERSIVIASGPEPIWEIIKNQERFPEFMPDVDSVKVTATKQIPGSRNWETTTEWETSIDGTPIIWVEKDNFYPDQYRIAYQLIEGDLDKFEGDWKIEVNEVGTCLVTLKVDYDFGIPELTNLIGPTLKQKVGENSEMMLGGIKRKVEAA